MATTLANCRIELSKQSGDYWASSTTSAGAAGGTTLVDTALKAKSNDWVTADSESWDLITEAAHAALNEERKISSLVNSSGTLTVLAHTVQIDTGSQAIDYEVHRMASASDKRLALIAACREAFPNLYKDVRDESHVSGNFLKDGSFERWTTSTNLTDWNETTCTVTQTSSAGLFKHGAYSAKLSSTAGNLAQRINDNEDLKFLQGRAVTFTVQGKSDRTDSLRIGISDGTTTTYSSYLAQTTGWTRDSEPLTVQATIQDNPSAVTFTIYHDHASATDYVDDARVTISGLQPRIYIGELGLHKNRPHAVYVEPRDYYIGTPWVKLHGVQYDMTNGYMYLPESVPVDYRLRILGTGTLDFLASGSSSTAWTATVAVDQPQLDILIAQAILYMYTQMALPNFSSGDRKAYQEMMAFWERKLYERKAKFSMPSFGATVNWT